jgi:hypothetical protein
MHFGIVKVLRVKNRASFEALLIEMVEVFWLV